MDDARPGGSTDERFRRRLRWLEEDLEAIEAFDK